MKEQTKTKEQKNKATAIITSGSISKAVWYLAWPTAVHTIIQTAYMNINPMFLGHMAHGAKDALAATLVGRTAGMIQFSLLFGLSVGTSALVARFLGAEQHDDADEATRQSLILCVIFGFLTMIPLVWLAKPIAALAGAKGSVIPLAASYTGIIAYSSIPAFLSMVIMSALRSAGDVKRPLYAGGITTILNVLLDYLLIFGTHPVHFAGVTIPAIPAMGLRGAAMATNIARAVGALLMLYYLKQSVLTKSLSHFKVQFSWFSRIMNIGWPAALQNFLFATNWAVYIWMLGGLPNGTTAQAALTASIALESLAFLPGSAYSMAATALVGQNLGAGKIKRAEHSAWVATGQAALLMSVVSLFFIFTPVPLARMFIGASETGAATSAAVVPLIVWYLRANAISEPLFAVGMTLRGALQGAGDVRMPTVITAGSLWVMRLPLTWFLARTCGFGAPGAWTAMSITTGLSGILTAMWFKWGSWRTSEI